MKLSGFVIRGSGKTAFDMAEQFGLDQLFRDSGAVHFHERHSRALALCMQRSGDQFLARSAFPVNQHASVGWRGNGDELPQRFHGHAFAQQLVMLFELDAQPFVFCFQAHLFERVAHRHQRLLE